jgi:hypothetical protein
MVLIECKEMGIVTAEDLHGLHCRIIAEIPNIQTPVVVEWSVLCLLVQSSSPQS